MNKGLGYLLMVSGLVACGGGGGGGNSGTPLNPDPAEPSSVLTIPVVVHVLYEDEYPDSNLSDEKILSQIAVLNKDFRALNEDLNTVPEEFQPFVADVGLEFKMAEIDPDGLPTNGITRTERSFVDLDGVHFTNAGGRDAWPTDQYLNIWLYDTADRNGNVGAVGRAQSPGGNPLTDGVVLDYRAMGTLPPLYGSYTKGRTATHEIGHWLDLRHIFATNGSCEASDLVDDTPTALNQYEGKPTHPSSSCGSNDMFMNFMDYSDDDVLVMFTKGQKERMRAVFEPGGGRYDLYLNITTDND